MPGPHGPGVQHGLVGVRQVPGHGLQGRQAQDLLPAPELPPAARGRRHRGQEGRPGGVGLRGEVPRHHRLQQTVRAPDHGLAEQGPQLRPHRDPGREPRHPHPLLRRGQLHAVRIGQGRDQYLRLRDRGGRAAHVPAVAAQDERPGPGPGLHRAQERAERARGGVCAVLPADQHRDHAHLVDGAAGEVHLLPGRHIPAHPGAVAARLPGGGLDRGGRHPARLGQPPAPGHALAVGRHRDRLQQDLAHQSAAEAAQPHYQAKYHKSVKR